MEYDIVLATRNRHSMLSISIPLMLSQSKLPSNFILVDSSDDHNIIKTTVNHAFLKASSTVKLQIIHTNPGSAYQRNIGLKSVQSPIVIFPDDDSLWFPDTAKSILDIYERDICNEIGGVCAVSSTKTPLDHSIEMPYKLNLTFKLKRGFVKYLSIIRKKYFPDPLFCTASFEQYNRDIPRWLSDCNAHITGPMQGFRMSFRTDLIRKIGFDESLGRYALSEDLDASLSIMKQHLIVCANNSKVCHYSYPSNRVDGRELGMMHVLNRTYIVCKHNPPQSVAREQLKGFINLNLFFSLLRLYSKYQRQKFYGSFYALRYVKRLLDAKPYEIQETYCTLRNECIQRLGVK